MNEKIAFQKRVAQSYFEAKGGDNQGRESSDGSPKHLDY